MESLSEKYIRKIKEINDKYIYTTLKRKEESCNDEEEYHKIMDNLLVELIKELGYEKVAELYEKASEWFWYS